MKGRKPLPANVHLLRGNPSKLPAEKLHGGVSPDVEIPAAPRHLKGEALKEWKRITAELAQLGLVTAIDRAALTMYVESWATYTHALQKIAALNGELIVTHKNGFQGPSAWLTIRDKAGEQCRKLLVEFGMSPSSRARVTASRQADLFGDDGGVGRLIK